MNACAAPAWFLADDTDCNDASSVAWPGAPEVWYDDEDEDCAGGDDWDQDLDGYAAPDADCLDTDPAVSPAGTEVCGNHLDDDCDQTDNGCSWTGPQPLGSADAVVRGTVVSQNLGTSWAVARD
ncbi:MAG: hypothetical protein EXR71_19335 [Myxococcales bacterium]|nr:hypothetical protein [Myxococcales bacterium]